MQTYRLFLLALAALLLCLVAWLLASAGNGPTSPARVPSTPHTEESVGTRRTKPDTSAPDPTVHEDPVQAEAPEPAPRLVVRVLANEDGRPLADASVRYEPEQGEPVDARTSTAGSVEFELVPGVVTRVTARVPGRVRTWRSMAPATPGERHELELVMLGGEVLSGVVVGADGVPLMGVRLALEEGGTLGNTSTAVSPVALGRSTTDALGEFRFEGVPAGVLVTVHAQHPAHAHLQRTVRLSEGGGNAPLTLQLAPGGVLRGVVRDGDLKPAAGSRVLVAPSTAAYLIDAADGSVFAVGGPSARLDSAKVGEDGRYEVHGLHLDTPYAVVAVQGDAARSLRHDAIVTRADAPTATLDLQLQPLLALTVRVATETGELLDEAHVLCLTGRRRRVVRADDGTLRVAGLAAGEVVLEVGASGLVTREVRHTLTADETIEVILEPGLTVAGLVVNDTGDPVAGAQVHVTRPARPAEANQAPSLGVTETGADGRFSAGGLRDGSHAIYVWANGHARGHLQAVSAGARNVRVVVERMGRLEAVLRLPGGALPPATLTVSVHGEHGGTNSEVVPWPEESRLRRTVAPGRGTLILTIEGHAAQLCEYGLSVGETRDLGVLAFGPGFSVSGRLRTLAGAPVPGAEVHVTAPWEFDARVLACGTDGAFRIPNLAGTAYRVKFVAPGFLPFEAEHDPREGDDWSADLAEGALVTGSVRSEETLGPRHGFVWLVPLGSSGDRAGGAASPPQPAFAIPDVAGNYSIRVLSGRYRVEYRPRGGEPHVGRVLDLEDGDREVVTFTLDS